MTRLLLCVLAFVVQWSVAFAGYSNGQVVNGFTYQNGYWVKGGYSYHPYTYYGKTYYTVKSVGYDIKQRILDLAQQKQQAQEAIELAKALGLTPADTGILHYQQYNPYLNAVAQGQSVLYGNGSHQVSAAQFIVGSEAQFDHNAFSERQQLLLGELAKALGTNLQGASAFAGQFAQIETIKTQAATTIAEKQEGTKQIELLIQALLAVQPKDKAVQQWTGGAAGPAEKPAENTVFAARGLAACLVCHSEEGQQKAKDAARFDGDITADLFLAATEAMDSGHMPPKDWQDKNGAWTDADSAAVRNDLRALMAAK